VDEEARRRNLFATNNNNIKQEKHNIKVNTHPTDPPPTHPNTRIK